MELKFAVDTKHRKGWFTGMSFSHPAKMSLPLQLWIIENYTKEGDTILDPMAGSGTILVACSMGRNVIAVELEQKFIDMMQMHGNWEKIKQRGAQMGCSMGTCQIIQGDARQLEGLLAGVAVDCDLQLRTCRGEIPYPQQVDKIITSPPHGDAYSIREGGQVNKEYVEKRKEALRKQGKDKLADSLRVEEYGSRNPNNLGNLSYGDIDAVITSPPYEGSITDGGDNFVVYGQANSAYYDKDGRHRVKVGKVRKGVAELRQAGQSTAYSSSGDNIGNLKQDNYLSAMLAVYRQCFAVLKSGGLLILVTKNFIRQKKIIRLDLDTIKLCEQAGFGFVERHYRKLPAQSFWRILYMKKHPEVEPIEYEDILIFRKESK